MRCNSGDGAIDGGVADGGVYGADGGQRGGTRSLDGRVGG